MGFVIDIIKIIVLILSITLLVSSFVRLYRWRRSAFSSTNAYLKNLRQIHPYERVCIQAPDEPGKQYVCSGKDSRPYVYFEYIYTVEGIKYCKSYFSKDDGDELPSKIIMHYNIKNPKMVFQDGEVRDGVLISIVFIFFSLFMLFALVATYIW